MYLYGPVLAGFVPSPPTTRYAGFQGKFGKTAFTLNHRFYLHLDRANQLWLSAEDGCEGYPYQLPSKA